MREEEEDTTPGDPLSVGPQAAGARNCSSLEDSHRIVRNLKFKEKFQLGMKGKSMRYSYMINIFIIQ